MAAANAGVGVFGFFMAKLVITFLSDNFFGQKNTPPPIFLQIVDLQYIVYVFWRFDFFSFWLGEGGGGC